jgi:hypothetical protein
VNTSAEQLGIEQYRAQLASNTRDRGADLASWADQDWQRRAASVLDSLIESGIVFTAQDVRDVVGSPSSPGGALFLRAARDGRIISQGFETSRRQSRHGGVVRRWRAP